MKALEVVQNYRNIVHSNCMWDGHFVIAEKVQFWQAGKGASNNKCVCIENNNCEDCRELLDKDVVCIDKYLPQNGYNPYKKRGE